MQMFYNWLSYGAWLVGWPVIVILFLLGLQASVFTVGCVAADWKCEYSITATGANLRLASNASRALNGK